MPAWSNCQVNGPHAGHPMRAVVNYFSFMKVTFVYPRFEKFLETYPELAELPAVAATWAFRMPPALGIPILANLLPADVSFRVIDQNIEPVDFSDDADVVAISYFTPQAGFAYEIGDEFLRRGKTVIAGGMHPSTMPEEAALHCTSRVRGRGRHGMAGDPSRCCGRLSQKAIQSGNRTAAGADRIRKARHFRR